MIPSQVRFLGLAALIGLSLPSSPSAAATNAGFEPSSGPTSSSGWLSWLADDPGEIYQNEENPWLQEFALMGRFQYQLAHLDGDDVNNQDFNETHDEYRRARLGAKGKFLRYFGFKYQVNLVDDTRNKAGGGDLDWGYQDIDEAYLSFDLGEVTGADSFDHLRLSYGRQKFVFSQEAHTSSKKLLTVERSAISNKVYGSARPTGLKLDGAFENWSFLAALYSSTTDGQDNEEFNGWQDGEIFYSYIAHQIDASLKIGLDLTYNNADAASEDSVLSYRWATSLHGVYDAGSWGVTGDLIYGDNGGSDMVANANRQGNFWGFVVMPYYWVFGEKLQLVGQYQYAASEESEGIRVNSRYARADGTGAPPSANVNSGRGDRHDSFYLGLNYYLSGHNAKVQAGFEYQNMDTPIDDFETLTWQLAFRSFF